MDSGNHVPQDRTVPTKRRYHRSRSDEPISSSLRRTGKRGHDRRPPAPIVERDHPVTTVAELRAVTKLYRRGVDRSNWRALIPGRLGEPSGADHLVALDDISLRIEPGDSVGVIGPNGAGKSTLLKVMAGIIEPTSGEVHTHGRVAAVTELGSGFTPDLTGAENLRFSAALMGLPAGTIDERFDEIVDFSGIGEFIDTPVKRYSTGMRARLSFALATSVDAD
ncbi:MAG: ATP-binding cassette domain-containing protein, partial [Acidobacteria bacterium]|nr:ATP-binding cassette domain-containing protein [Acidobacteriota bacterium]